MDYIKVHPDFQMPTNFYQLSSEQQRDLAIRQLGEDEWRVAKGKVKAAKLEQQLLKRKGIPSGHTYSAAKRLVGDEMFYLPIRYDFRGRVVMRFHTSTIRLLTMAKHWSSLLTLSLLIKGHSTGCSLN